MRILSQLENVSPQGIMRHVGIILKAMFILIILALISPSHGQEIGYGLATDSLSLQVLGNCLPYNLEEISLDHEFNLSDSSFLSLKFINTSEIAAVTRSGELFICDLNTHKSRMIAELGERTSWRLCAEKQGEFLLIGFDYVSYIGDEFTVVCLDQNGNRLWSHEFYDYPIIPVTDKDKYIFLHEGPNDNAALYSLDSEGSHLLDEWEIPISDLHGLSTTPFGLLSPGISNGPYTIQWGGERYELGLWNETWDNGCGLFVVDPEGRFVSTYRNARDLLIINRGREKATVLPFLEMVGIVEEGPRHPVCYKIASNGESIVIMYGYYLIKYSNNEFVIWRDDLYEPGEEFWPRELIIDISCTKFLLTTDGRILLGDGKEIEEIPFDGPKPTFMTFNDDYSLAAFGAGGSIMVWRMVGT